VTKDIDIADLRRIAGAIQSHHGYDFHNYATSSFKRRILRILDLKKLSVDTLLEKIESQPQFMQELLTEIAVNVTEMFRDPPFWILLRDTIIPTLVKQKKGKPIRIWHAGCSTGEEVFSIAILLHEMHITRNVEILATDLDPAAVEKAKSGTFSLKHLEINDKNYSKLHTGNPLKTWFRSVKGTAILDPRLLKNIKFAEHDLVTDNIDETFDLVLCRNVMIYFNQSLQDAVLTKIHKNLILKGFLSIGQKESLTLCEAASKFETFSSEEKVYRKVKN